MRFAYDSCRLRLRRFSRAIDAAFRHYFRHARCLLELFYFHAFQMPLRLRFKCHNAVCYTMPSPRSFARC